MKVETEGAKKSNTGTIKFILKIAIASIILYFVYRKFNLQSFKEALISINPWMLIFALIAFNFSKWVSIFRIRDFLKTLDIQIPHIYNWKLYYIGAFYNLFLPGSVGGDGYKVYLLRKKYDKPVKQLISVVLLDRISGLAALVFITVIMLIFCSPFFPYQIHTGVAVAIVLYPAYYLMFRLFFKRFLPYFFSTNIYSIISQIFQTLTAYFLLSGLGIEVGIWNYLVLFMISSIISVIPITPGGLGIREYISLIAYPYLGLQKETAIIMATLFFLIMAISSLVGLIFQFTPNKKNS